MKLPMGQGMWPAFWMLPEEWRYGGWAASGGGASAGASAPAAQNHPFVYVLVDAADYQPLLDHLANENRSDEEDARMRKTLAWKAYQHCASYDSVASPDALAVAPGALIKNLSTSDI